MLFYCAANLRSESRPSIQLPIITETNLCLTDRQRVPSKTIQHTVSFRAASPDPIDFPALSRDFTLQPLPQENGGRNASAPVDLSGTL